jgi:hypothetical protein
MSIVDIAQCHGRLFRGTVQGMLGFSVIISVTTAIVAASLGYLNGLRMGAVAGLYIASGIAGMSLCAAACALWAEGRARLRPAPARSDFSKQ